MDSCWTEQNTTRLFQGRRHQAIYSIYPQLNTIVLEINYIVLVHKGLPVGHIGIGNTEDKLVIR